MEIDPPTEENEKKIDFAFSGESAFMNEVYEAIGEMQNTNTNLNETMVDYAESLKMGLDDSIEKEQKSIIDYLLSLDSALLTSVMVDQLRNNHFIERLLTYIIRKKNEDSIEEAKEMENSMKVTSFLSSNYVAIAPLLKEKGEVVVKPLADALMEDPPLPGFYHITGLLKFFVEYCPDESLKYITAQHICHYLKLLTYGCMLDFMKTICPYPDEDQDAGGQKYHIGEKAHKRCIKLLYKINYLSLVLQQMNDSATPMPLRVATCQLFKHIIEFIVIHTSYLPLMNTLRQNEVLDLLFSNFLSLVSTTRQQHILQDPLQHQYRQIYIEIIDCFLYRCLYQSMTLLAPRNHESKFCTSEDYIRDNYFFQYSESILTIISPYIQHFCQVFPSILPDSYAHFLYQQDPFSIPEDKIPPSCFLYSLLKIMFYCIQVIDASSVPLSFPPELFVTIISLLFIYPTASILHRILVDVFDFIFIRKYDDCINALVMNTNFIFLCNDQYNKPHSHLRPHILNMMHYISFYSQIQSKQELAAFLASNTLFQTLYDDIKIDSYKSKLEKELIDNPHDPASPLQWTDEELIEYVNKISLFTIGSSYATSIGFILDKNGNDI